MFNLCRCLCYLPTEFERWPKAKKVSRKVRAQDCLSKAGKSKRGRKPIKAIQYIHVVNVCVVFVNSDYFASVNVW